MTFILGPSHQSEQVYPSQTGPSWGKGLPKTWRCSFNARPVIKVVFPTMRPPMGPCRTVQCLKKPKNLGAYGLSSGHLPPPSKRALLWMKSATSDSCNSIPGPIIWTFKLLAPKSHWVWNHCFFAPPLFFLKAPDKNILPETNLTEHLKIGWKNFAFPFGVPNLGLFSGAFAVRECKPYENWPKYRGFTGGDLSPRKRGSYFTLLKFSAKSAGYFCAKEAWVV